MSGVVTPRCNNVCCAFAGESGLLSTNSLISGLLALYCSLLPRLDVLAGHATAVTAAPAIRAAIKRFREEVLLLFDSALRQLFITPLSSGTVSDDVVTQLSVAIERTFDHEWCGPGIDGEAIPCASFIEDYAALFKLDEVLKGIVARCEGRPSYTRLSAAAMHVAQHADSSHRHGGSAASPLPNNSNKNNKRVSTPGVHLPAVDQVRSLAWCVVLCGSSIAAQGILVL